MDIEFHLLAVSDKESNPIEAKTSFDKLYNGYRMFLFNAIKKTIDYKSQKEDYSKTIVNEVFYHIWNNPLDWSFNPETHKSMDSAFKAYISTIASFKKLEILRENGLYLNTEKTIINDENNDWIFNLTVKEYEILEDDLPNKSNIIEKVLSNLEEKKRDIARVYFMHYVQGKKMRPENILYMTNMFGTTWDNIRQIISRVKKDIKALIDKEVKNR